MGSSYLRKIVLASFFIASYGCSAYPAGMNCTDNGTSRYKFPIVPPVSFWAYEYENYFKRIPSEIIRNLRKYNLAVKHGNIKVQESSRKTLNDIIVEMGNIASESGNRRIIRIQECLNRLIVEAFLNKPWGCDISVFSGEDISIKFQP